MCLDCHQICVWSRCTAKVRSKFGGKNWPYKCTIRMINFQNKQNWL